jgi:gamma-glutamyl:cysteine ligase YbdK (ATP-grasp superfamily)
MERHLGFQDFMSLFRFKRRFDGYVGIERERFLMASDGLCIPRSAEFLALIRDARWTYELSACQVEDRTRLQKDLSAIKLELLENDNNGHGVGAKLGLRLVHQEVADRDMPLNVYPDPRSLRIASEISKEQLRAACRVTGTHLHFGTRSMKHAIALHNALVPHVEELCRLGDHSNGERIKIYKIMATNWKPLMYEGPQHFYARAQDQGFAENPRNCWHLIRISTHGTVELRMFGVTDHIDEVLSWISHVRTIVAHTIEIPGGAL